MAEMGPGLRREDKIEPDEDDHRQAARLLDPRAAGKLTSLEAALSALGTAIAIEVHEKPAA